MRYKSASTLGYTMAAFVINLTTVSKTGSDCTYLQYIALLCLS